MQEGQRETLVRIWREGKPSSTVRPRHVLAFDNYSDAGAAVRLENLTVSNIDFRDVESNGREAVVKPGVGSFIRARHSNLALLDVKVTNLSSSGNGSFLLLEDSQSTN